MIQVSECYDEAKKIVGNCSDVRLFRTMSDAVELIANKAELEGYKGWCDICTANNDRCVTLPREIGTVLAVNIGGRPTLGYSQLFNFHLNGPGDCGISCSWTWQDQGAFHATYRDIITPAKLIAYTESAADDNKRITVFGYDADGHELWHETGGVRRRGTLVPTLYGYAIPAADAPAVSRITAVDKEDMAGVLRLSTVDDSGQTGVLLGVYEPDERLPQYRRIKINRSCSWVRVAYKKSHQKITSQWDHLPLLSRRALLLAMRALKGYDESDFGIAHSFEADAARLELEAQMSIEPPTYFPIQVIDMNSPRDRSDVDIV